MIMEGTSFTIGEIQEPSAQGPNHYLTAVPIDSLFIRALTAQNAQVEGKAVGEVLLSFMRRHGQDSRKRAGMRWLSENVNKFWKDWCEVRKLKGDITWRDGLLFEGLNFLSSMTGYVFRGGY